MDGRFVVGQAAVLAVRIVTWLRDEEAIELRRPSDGSDRFERSPFSFRHQTGRGSRTLRWCHQ
jgi:hypothetical protein